MTVLTYRLAAADFVKASSAVTESAFPLHLRKGPAVVNGLAIGLLLALVATSSDIPLWFGLGGPLVLLALSFWLQRLVCRRLFALAYPYGTAEELTLRLDDSGFELESALGRGFCRWPGCWLVELPQGLVLVSGTLGFVPLPDSAFPDATERATIHREIAAHVTAAGGSRP